MKFNRGDTKGMKAAHQTAENIRNGAANQTSSSSSSNSSSSSTTSSSTSSSGGSTSSGNSSSGKVTMFWEGYTETVNADQVDFYKQRGYSVVTSENVKGCLSVIVQLGNNTNSNGESQQAFAGSLLSDLISSLTQSYSESSGSEPDSFKGTPTGALVRISYEDTPQGTVKSASQLLYELGDKIKNYPPNDLLSWLRKTNDQKQLHNEANAIRDAIKNSIEYQKDPNFKKLVDKTFNEAAYKNGNSIQEIEKLIAYLKNQETSKDTTLPQGAGNLPPWGYNGAPPSGWTGPETSTPSQGTGKIELTEEQMLLIKTVYGEAANCSEASWKAVANVIMNRVGSREWKKYDTITKVIKNSGFDAYTNPNDPYKTAEKYLNNRDGSNAKLEKLISIVLDVYNGKSEDNTNGAVLYYSPEAQSALHKKFPKSYPSLVPPWVNDKVEEVKVSGAEKDDFKFYRYK